MIELNLEEQTLIATYRSLDESGKKDLLRHASLQNRMEAATSINFGSGQCRLQRGEERPETVSEPIFTE